MSRFLLLFLLAIPLIELWLLIEVGSAIGGLTCILLVIATAMVGGLIARKQGFGVIKRIQERSRVGEPIVDEAIEGFALLFAGLLLLLPGLLTDALGFLLLWPVFRHQMRDSLLRSLVMQSPRQGARFYDNTRSSDPFSSSMKQQDKVIDIDTTKE